MSSSSAKNCPRAQLVNYIDDEQDSGLQGALTLCHETKRICMIIRGTESFVDIGKDLLMCLSSLHGQMFVHRGFASIVTSQAYEELRLEFVRMSKVYPEYRLFMTGHSLGVALATLSAFLLVTCASPVERVIHVVTFGSPRVGNVAWQQSFDNHPFLKHTRVTNHNDIITTLPYTNYHHTGDEFHFNGETWGYQDSREDPFYMCPFIQVQF